MDHVRNLPRCALYGDANQYRAYLKEIEAQIRRPLTMAETEALYIRQHAILLKGQSTVVDFPRTAARYRELVEECGREIARQDLHAAIVEHVDVVCPEMTIDGRKAQARLIERSVKGRVAYEASIL